MENNLLQFSSANSFFDKVFIDPNSVVMIVPLHKDRDMGEYSTIYLGNGISTEVSGSSTRNQELINKFRTPIVEF